MIKYLLPFLAAFVLTYTQVSHAQYATYTPISEATFTKHGTPVYNFCMKAFKEKDTRLPIKKIQAYCMCGVDFLFSQLIYIIESNQLKYEEQLPAYTLKPMTTKDRAFCSYKAEIK